MEQNPTPLPAPERTHFPWVGRTYPAPKPGCVLVLVVEDVGGALVEAMDLVRMSATEARLTRRVRKASATAFILQDGTDYVLHDGLSSEWLGESGAEAAWFLGGPASRY